MTGKPETVLMATAAVFVAAATGLGAYASHGLEGVLDPGALHSLETAINYQFFHSLGLLGVCIVCERRQNSLLLLVAGIAIAAGIVLFCGGVYASSFDGPGWISRLAPIGGVSLIIGWLLVAIGVVASAASR
ncbi:MAG: DUF423 domain-containing protein [Gammaproteobacteria bacterium]|jgi:uncharacterized membrane protein YgdD (TMEM256/DUF423 family)